MRPPDSCGHYGKFFLGAVVAGPVPLALIAMLSSLSTSGPSLLAVAGVVVFCIFALPFWIIGLGLIGLPAWWTVRRLGGRGAVAAGLTGAFCAGVVWGGTVLAFTTLPWGLYAALPATAFGALSGAVAGVAGWWTSRPKGQTA